MAGHWEGSTRRERLPRDWHQRRGHVLKRDHGICQVCGDLNATHADHIIPNDDDSYGNLRAVCADCHKTKSSAEGAAARRAKYSTQRGLEPHPGYIW